MSLPARYIRLPVLQANPLSMPTSVQQNRRLQRARRFVFDLFRHLTVPVLQASAWCLVVDASTAVIQRARRGQTSRQYPLQLG